MGGRITDDRDGRALTQVRCDGCARTAVSDQLTPRELCGLLAWECHCDEGFAYCPACEHRRRGATRLAGRAAEATAPAGPPRPARGRWRPFSGWRRARQPGRSG